MGVIFLLLICAGMIWWIVKWIQVQQEEKRAKEREAEEKRAAERAKKQKQEDEQNYLRNTRLGGEKEAERFYRECVKDGAKDAISEANQERIYLYAKKKNIAGSKEELVDAYMVGERIVNKEKAQKALERENRDMEEKQKYIHYHGREKLIRYLEDQIQYYTSRHEELGKAYRAANEAQDRLYLGLKQNETDWAVAGGIANGLAGPAAGIATAIDVQQKNAGIRANNASLYNAISTIGSMSTDSMIRDMVRADDFIKTYSDALDKIKSCLVEDGNIESRFKDLNCNITETKISNSGAAQVIINIKQPNNLKIYGDVPALVDGSLKTTIYTCGTHQEIASCVIGLDYYTVRNREGHFSVYLRGNSIPPDFEAEITPVDLWAIEDWQKTKGTKRSY